MLFTKRALVLLFSTVIFLTTFSPVRAENYTEPLAKNPMLEIGFKKDHVYDVDGICTVDRVNGNLIVRIPVATLTGKNGREYTQYLQYNSNLVKDVYFYDGAGDPYINTMWDDACWQSDTNPAWALELPNVEYSEYGEGLPLGGIRFYNRIQCQGMVGESFTVMGTGYIGWNTPDYWNEEHLFYGDNSIVTENKLSAWPYRKVDLLDVASQTHFIFGGAIGSYKAGYSRLQGWAEAAPTALNAGLSDHVIPNTPIAVESPLIHVFDSTVTYPEGDTLGFTFSRSDDAAVTEPSKLNKIWFRFNSDETKDRSIICHYTDNAGERPFLSSLEWTSVNNGAASTNFEYETAATKTLTDGDKHFKRLKKIILADGSSYEFEYYSTDGKVTPSGSDMRANGNAYLDLGSATGHVYVLNPDTGIYELHDQTIHMASGFPLLKCIYLPTGGRIDIEYQIQGFLYKYEPGREEGFDEEWNGVDEQWGSIALGVKSLKYYSSRTSQTPVMTKEYKLLKVYDLGENPGSMNFDYPFSLRPYNDFEVVDYTSMDGGDLWAMFLAHLSYDLWTLNPSGRRIVEKGENGNLSVSDTIYNVGIKATSDFVEKKYRNVVKTINYLVPEPPTLDNPNPDSTKGRIETNYNYLTRRYLFQEDQTLAYLPIMERITYTDHSFPSNVEKDTYENSAVVRKDKTLTSYYGITDKAQPVLQYTQSSKVTDGADVTLYSISQANTFDFNLSYDGTQPWGSDRIAKIKQIFWQEGNTYWMKKYEYNSPILPWLISSIQWGPSSSEMSFSGDYRLQADLDYWDNSSTDALGFNKGYLLKTRTLSMRDQTGVLYKPTDLDGSYPFVNGLAEHFDYTVGILKSYTMGDGTPSLTTTRTIDAGTGLVKSQTNPDGTSVSYDWDSSNRLTGIHPIGGNGTPLTATTIAYANYNSASNIMANVVVTGPKTNKYYYDGLGRLTYEGAMAWNGQFDWSKVEYQGLEQAEKSWTGLRLAGSAFPWTEDWSTVARTEHTFDGYGRETETKVFASGDTPEATTTTSYAAFNKTLALYKGAKGVTPAEAESQRDLVYDAKGNLKELKIFRKDEDAKKQGWITKVIYEYSPLLNKLSAVHLNKDDENAGQDRTFTYDALGNLITTVTPEEGTITYSGYNLFGKPSTKTQGTVDPNSDHRIVSFTYDALGRETERNTVETKPGDPDYPITETIKTSWGDAGISNGKIAQLQSKLADKLLTQIDYEYDLITGNLKTKKVSLDTDTSVPGFEIANKEIGLTYDLNGNLKTLAYPMESISGFTNAVRTLTLEYYSTNNQPRELSYRFTDSTRGYTYPDQPKALVGSMIYEPTGGITYNTGDTLSNVITNDTLGRLSGITYGDNLLAFSNYTYDARGNITQLHKTGPGADVTNTYTYDDYNRLRIAHYSGTDYGKSIDTIESFNYDYAGNMTTKNCNDPSIGNILKFANKAYNSKNQDPSMTYDDYGNVTGLTVPDKSNALALAYNPFNQVTSVTEGTNRYEYTYDGEGKRVVKKIYKNNTELTEIHIYIRGATGKILEELKKVKQENGTWSDWTWVKDYYYFGDKLISAASAE